MFHRFGKPLVIDMKEVELFDVVLSQLDQVMPGLSKELLSKELLRKERYVATMETYRSFIQCVCILICVLNILSCNGLCPMKNLNQTSLNNNHMA